MMMRRRGEEELTMRAERKAKRRRTGASHSLGGVTECSSLRLAGEIEVEEPERGERRDLQHLTRQRKRRTRDRVSTTRALIGTLSTPLAPRSRSPLLLQTPLRIHLEQR